VLNFFFNIVMYVLSVNEFVTDLLDLMSTTFAIRNYLVEWLIES